MIVGKMTAAWFPFLRSLLLGLMIFRSDKSKLSVLLPPPFVHRSVWPLDGVAEIHPECRSGDDVGFPVIIRKFRFDPKSSDGGSRGGGGFFCVIDQLHFA